MAVGYGGGCFSSFFLIRRSSMKFSAVIVQRTLANKIIIDVVSIEAGSFPLALGLGSDNGLVCPATHENTTKTPTSLLAF